MEASLHQKIRTELMMPAAETKTPVILVPRAKLSIGTDSKHDHTSKSSTDKSAIPAPPPKANHSSIVSQPDAGDVKFLSDRKSMWKEVVLQCFLTCSNGCYSYYANLRAKLVKQRS